MAFKNKSITLDQFRDLKTILKDKKDFKFTVSDNRDIGYGGIKYYPIVDSQFKGVYDPLNYVTITIYRDRVELDTLSNGFKKFTYTFDQKDLDDLYNMSEIESIEYCIISAVNKWDSYYLD